MRQFISFVIKETRHILRDTRTMLILFVMPVVMMLIFGFAITNDVKNVRTVVVTSQMDHQTQASVNRLSTSEYFNVIATVETKSPVAPGQDSAPPEASVKENRENAVRIYRTVLNL